MFYCAKHERIWETIGLKMSLLMKRADLELGRVSRMAEEQQEKLDEYVANNYGIYQCYVSIMAIMSHQMIQMGDKWNYRKHRKLI